MTRPLVTPMTERQCADWLRRQTPEYLASANTAWMAVMTEIEARASATRPRPATFEVYHERVKAQCAFVTALTVCGFSMAQNEARAAIGLPEVDHE